MLDFVKYIHEYAIDNPSLALLIVIALVIYLYTELYLSKQGKPGQNKRSNPLYKELKVADKNEASGIIFGLMPKGSKKSNKVLYSPSDAPGHCLVVGGTGLGKTSSILLPTINSWNKKNPKNTCLVIDISGDISRDSTIGNRIIYEPVRLKDSDDRIITERTRTPYNIFGCIDIQKTVAEKEKALALLAHLIMPDDPNASEAGAYYNEEGRKMLTASLTAFYFKGMDFVEICEEIVSSSWRNLLNNIDSTRNHTAITLINSFEGVDERFTSSAKQACDKNLSLFVTDKEVRESIRRPKDGEIAFEPSVIEYKNCFVRIPDEQLEYLAPLTQILTAQCLDYFKSRSLKADHQILLCLDEMASLGIIDVLPGLRKYRKRKVSILCLTQGLVDLDLTYSEKNRKAQMSNFRFKVILDSSEPDEQEYWARLIGYDTQINLSQTGNSVTQTEKREYLVEPSEFANLGDKLIVIYPGGYRKLYKNFWFK